ncbi:uncharacterized protein LOC116013618 [Ipomoea triloba]|uniref:uncharacterized protein LOC116013618 n=1 Tax=Ipomoea triloba TaxID=35885 RepID=UPI00125D7F45|nr:uncharacterized protein LOC116013618 [Ipomoea triloba]
MEANKWFRSFSTGGRNIQLGRHYGEDEASKKESIWKVIWRKFSKEKRNKNKNKTMMKGRFEFSRSVHVQIPSYDEYTYSQNFDKGSNWDEPDQLLRSFSVRYADRSRMMIFK